MEPVLLQVGIPLVGCIASAASAVAIGMRDPRDPGVRVATVLVAASCWWSLCNVLWSAAPTAEEARLWHRLAAPGWAFIGPLALHLVLRLGPAPPRAVMRALPFLYAVGAVHMVLQMTTRLVHDGVHPSPFGWAFEPAVGFRVHLAFTYACVLPAVAVALRRVLTAPSPARRSQGRLVAAAIAAPLLLASATAAVFPLLGIPSPRLASASFGLLGVAMAWSYHRYGFSALVPGSFSREILATLSDGVCLVDLDGRVLSANAALARLLAEPQGSLVGLPLSQRLSVPILGEPKEGVECQLARRGEETLPVAISTARLRDKRGLAVGVVLVVRDLREVMVLRSQLFTSGRLAAVGELAAGIAHEINNPTAFVRANLSQLQDHWEELRKELCDEPLRERSAALLAEGSELLAESLEGIERTAAIVRDVRSFAHGGSGEREAVAVNELVDQALRVASPQLRHRARVVRRFSDVPPAWGSPQELRQVLLNLIVNAAQALEERGTVEVATRLHGSFVEVSVRDDGVGIAPEHRERIFDPFFTTKPAGEGTGLGLSISYQILRAQGADIQFESQPGVGTTFTVRIPRAPET